jgi:hypothetical protein
MTVPETCRPCPECVVTKCSLDHKAICRIQVSTGTGIKITYKPVDPDEKPPEWCQRRKS